MDKMYKESIYLSLLPLFFEFADYVAAAGGKTVYNVVQCALFVGVSNTANITQKYGETTQQKLR